MKRILMPLCFATTPMLFAFFVLFLLPFSHSFSFAATNNMEKIRNEQAREQERKQILERIRRGAGTKPDRPRLDKQDDPRLNDPRLYDGPLDDSSGEFGNEFSGCGSGDVPGPISCADLASNPASVSGHGWQTVTNTLSEASCNLGHTDSVSGPGQLVLYDNTYTVACVNGGYEPSVYLGETPPDSNWGAYTTPSETCKMKTGPRPSDGTRVIETIVCPGPDDGHRDDGDGRHDDRGVEGRYDDRGDDGRVGISVRDAAGAERVRLDDRSGDGRRDDRRGDGRDGISVRDAAGDERIRLDDRSGDGRQDDRGGAFELPKNFYKVDPGREHAEGTDARYDDSQGGDSDMQGNVDIGVPPEPEVTNLKLHEYEEEEELGIVAKTKGEDVER